MSDWKHKKVKPPAGYPNEDWPEGVYLKAADGYIAELEAKLERLEKANYEADKILADGVAELLAKLERLREAITSAVGGMRAPYRTSSYVHILREDFDRLMEALEGSDE